MNRTLLSWLILLVAIGTTHAAEEQSDEADDEESTRTEVTSHELGHVLQQSAKPERAAPTRARATTAPAAPATRGNPDRPVIVGRTPNAAGGSADRPTESLSLNFDKIRSTSVKVKSTHRQQSRVIVRGWDSKFYALPDGTYKAASGGQLVVSRGTVQPQASGDVVVKGKKILQNYLPDGRFSGPGGAWIEVSGGKINSVGGQLERHRPPPFIDVNGDGSVTIRGE